MRKNISKNQLKQIIKEELIAILLEKKLITEQQLLEEDLSNIISRLLPGSSERSWRKWLKKNPENEEEIETALQAQGPDAAAKTAQELSDEDIISVEPAEKPELSDEDIISVEPAEKPASAPESPPRLPIKALAQRKDIIVLPKSAAKLKKILLHLVPKAMKDVELEFNWEPLSPENPFINTLIVKMMKYLRQAAGSPGYIKNYLQENKTNLIYIKESRLKEILTKEIQEKAQEWRAQ